MVYERIAQQDVGSRGADSSAAWNFGRDFGGREEEGRGALNGFIGDD